MAGFMGQGLGFASTTGAFIGGAARQANELFAESRKQDYQNDILQQAWAADADKSAQKWNEKKQNYADQIAIRQSILQQTGGNEQAADAVMARLKLNPKLSQDEINAAVKAYSSVPTPANYKSPFMQNLQSSAEAGFQAAQTPLNRVSPKYQNRVTPITPWTPLESTQQQGATSGETPAQSATPSGQQGYSPGALSPEENTAPASGEPIPLDNLNKPSVAPAPLDIPGKSQVMTPYQAQRIKQGEESRQLDQEKFEFQKQTKPATPQEAADIQVQTDDAKKYLHDPKTGLQFRYGELRNLASQNIDITEMYDALNRGLLANKPQPLFDEINRVVKPLLGISLEDMGVSNTIQDTTLMKKAISNAIINRLSTLHFGRITNKEAQYVQDGLGSTSTDPNTNMKIILALQASVKSAMDGVNKEYQAVYSNPNKSLMQRAQEGRQVQIQAYNDYISKGDTPWPRVHTTDEALAMPIGQWFEDDKGQMRIRTQEGNTPAAFKKAGDKL